MRNLETALKLGLVILATAFIGIKTRVDEKSKSEPKVEWSDANARVVRTAEGFTLEGHKTNVVYVNADAACTIYRPDSNGPTMLILSTNADLYVLARKEHTVYYQTNAW